VDVGVIIEGNGSGTRVMAVFNDLACDSSPDNAGQVTWAGNAIGPLAKPPGDHFRQPTVHLVFQHSGTSRGSGSRIGVHLQINRASTGG